jgi:hypothetical protein
MQEEKWKDIEDYEGRYQVSSHGRVKSLARVVNSHPKTRKLKDKIRKLSTNRYGYSYISLKKDGKLKALAIHRLVAIAFIQNPENKPCVNHLNGIKADNNISNLEWVTYSENTIHAHQNNLVNHPCGEKCHSSKLKTSDVLKIRELFTKGATQRELAELYKVTHQNIHLIVRRKSWENI